MPRGRGARRRWPAGADMVQLRDRVAGRRRPACRRRALRAACDEHDALLWINDRPDLALAAGADGVHVGQDDAPVAEVRARVGPDLLIGLSTHSPEQLDAGDRRPAPTSSAWAPCGRRRPSPAAPPPGLDYVRHAAAPAPGVPWFAIGGIDAETLPAVRDAGRERVVVVRAVRDAADPRGRGRELLRRLLEESPVGAARSRKRRKARQRAAGEPARRAV